jgi:hypothetical protein
MKPKPPTIKRTPGAVTCHTCARAIKAGRLAEHWPAGAWTPPFWVCSTCAAAARDYARDRLA